MRVKKPLTPAQIAEVCAMGFVVKVVRGKHVICKAPDMSRVKRTQAQKDRQKQFGDAAKFAKSVIDDPKQKARFKVKKGQSVFNAAVAYYLKKHK